MGLMSSCPGSKVLKNPIPETIECSECGQELEIWTDELVVKCNNCGASTYKQRGPSCIEWCKHAESCVGPELYRKFKLNTL